MILGKKYFSLKVCNGYKIKILQIKILYFDFAQNFFKMTIVPYLGVLDFWSKSGDLNRIQCHGFLFQSSSILFFSFYLITKLIYWISFFIELEKKWNLIWTLKVVFVDTLRSWKIVLTLFRFLLLSRSFSNLLRTFKTSGSGSGFGSGMFEVESDNPLQAKSICWRRHLQLKDRKSS